MVISIYFILVFIPHSASITFNFTHFSTQNLNTDIVTNGDAYISNDGIQVTPDGTAANQSFKAGRAEYVKLFHLWDEKSSELASFDTSFSFVIASITDISTKGYADGFTFFLAENNSLIALGGGNGLPVDNITYTKKFPFVAVEFDTYCDIQWDPYCANPSINQITCSHVGINVNSLNSSRYQYWPNNVTEGLEFLARVTYDSASKSLRVSVDDDLINLELTIDLKEVLPEWVLFGFSAGTGTWYEKNSIKSWTFTSSDLQVDEEKAPPPASIPKNLTQNTRLPPTTSQNPVTGTNSGRHMAGLIAGLSIVLLSVSGIFAVLLWRRMKSKREEVEEDAYGLEMNKDFEMGTGPKRFSYQKLVQATDGFVEANKLGQGGFGGVYKGFLKDLQTYIAVKRVSKTSEQGIKEYASEVKIISQLRHKNLVELKGWCHEKGELMLVYEFMENGSLDLHLFKRKSLLTWGTRYRIAHGLASALLYLHEDWEQCVLHRDIKSSNVMLDSNFNVKLGDFGLAKLVDHEKGSQTTMLAGTLGYMAPECVVMGKASKESDVFSFGVVALEIACGRKSIKNTAPEKQIWLVEWVWKLYETGTLHEAVDPSLGLDFEEEEIKRLMTVGLWCVQLESGLRPSMRQVIHVLNSEASLPALRLPVASYLTPSMSLFSDTFIDQNQSSSSVSTLDSSK